MRHAIFEFEALLSKHYGVQRFTDAPGCVLRISNGKAKRRITLSDGTEIRAGDPLIDLHWLNQHLPHIPAQGANLAWAVAMRRALDRSLGELANHLAHPDRPIEAIAIRGNMAFGTRLGPPQVSRWVQRYGFELMAQNNEADLMTRLRDAGDSLLLLALTWAFNPGGLRGKKFFRDRYEIWTSRTAFTRRFQTRSKLCRPGLVLPVSLIGDVAVNPNAVT